MTASKPDREAPIEAAAGVLRDILAAGPLPAAEVRKAVEGCGLGWRTAERAAKEIGVESRKTGRHWEWRLPDAKTASVEYRQRKVASREDRQPAPPAATANLNAVLADISARLERLEAVLGPKPAPRPTLGPKPAHSPAASGSPGWDWRRILQGQWQHTGAVRCADCLHADAVEDRGGAGHCPAGEREVRALYARRTCPAFQIRPHRGRC